MTTKPLKPKPCKVCKTGFHPIFSTQIVCSWLCAATYAEQQRKKREAKDLRERKKKLKPRSQELKEAQVEFNKYIRLRDADQPCISCQRFHSGQYHAGHYRTVGACPSLRFEESNVHKQCSACNNHLSGNIVNYRKNLVIKAGIEIVEWLEGPHEPLHLTIPEIQAIKAKYKALCNELLKKRKDAA